MSKRKTVVIVHRKGRRPQERPDKLVASRTNRTDEQRKVFNQLNREEERFYVPRGAGASDVLAELE